VDRIVRKIRKRSADRLTLDETIAAGPMRGKTPTLPTVRHAADGRASRRYREKMMAPVPFDSRDGAIWFDGKFVDWKDAKVHVLTHGLHYASAVFEGERAYGGEIFKLEAHTDRLIESARLLGFQIPYSAEAINAACRETFAKTGLTDGYIRPIAWRGSEMMGVSAQHNTIHLAIAAWEWPSYFSPEERLKGIRLDMAEYRRPDPRTAPSKSKAAGLYMICTISKHAAEAKGYADAMMLDYRGYVAEATGANIFFVKDGKIHTPTADCFLNGITRQTVIGLAKARGYEVIERHIQPEELPTFSECFLTGSAAEVTPVSEIGPHRFQAGTITATLLGDYMAAVQPKSARAAAE
jgi:branched-chain amino acid aminotransferase